jgi:hypothetical protein
MTSSPFFLLPGRIIGIFAHLLEGNLVIFGTIGQQVDLIRIMGMSTIHPTQALIVALQIAHTYSSGNDGQREAAQADQDAYP